MQYKTKSKAKLQGKFNRYGEPSFEKTCNVENCAEIWSARDAILNGADYDNLVFRTELLYNKIYDSPCENCRVTFEGKYVIDD